jgi:hypothetical protein
VRLVCVAIFAGAPGCSLVFSDYDRRFDAMAEAASDASSVDDSSDVLVIAPCDAAIPFEAGSTSVACPDDKTQCTTGPCCIVDADGGAVILGCNTCSGQAKPWACDQRCSSGLCCINSTTFARIDWSACPAVATLAPPFVDFASCTTNGPLQGCPNGEAEVCGETTGCPKPDDGGAYVCRPVALASKVFGLCVH